MLIDAQYEFLMIINVENSSRNYETHFFQDSLINKVDFWSFNASLLKKTISSFKKCNKILLTPNMVYLCSSD